MHAVIDFILKIDERLFSLTETYGAWVYGAIFLVVFAETGLVVTPLLPGDSLLFAAGALCGAGLLNPWIMATALLWPHPRRRRQLQRRPVPRAEGVLRARPEQPPAPPPQPRAPREGARLLREARRQSDRHCTLRAHRSHLRPVCRRRRLHELPRFRLLQRRRRVSLGRLVFRAGILFGNVPIVKENFSAVAIIIIFISVLPVAWEFIKARRAR